MKHLKLVSLLFPLCLLAACSSSSTKEDPSAATDVIVEERGGDGASTSGIDGQGVEGSEYGAETQVIVGEDAYQGNELNDPDSPLSNRVVYFEYDSASVRSEDIPTLEAHAAYLAENPNITVRVEGHTDDRGSREYNLALGERRALSIRQLLMLQGASIEQFQVSSYGEERPAMEGMDESAWSLNRRVEIIYLGQ
jgi:peptidoglycan-associated lipoprotein